MFKKIGFTFFITSIFFLKSFCQFTATWDFTVNNTGVKAGTQQANINIGNAIIGSAFTSNVGYSSNGVKCQPTSGTDWPIVPTDGWQIDFPISPNAAVDATLTGLTFVARTSGSSNSNLVSLAYQADGVGNFIPFGTVQTATSGGTTNINFGTLSRKLYSGHTYLIRLYMYGATAGISASRSLSIKTNVFTGTTATAGTQPTVTTTTATKTGKYTATVSGVVTAGTLNVTESGSVWSLTANPTVNLSTKNNTGPTTSGNINFANGGSLTGLTAATTYNTRAYVISESADVFYGTNLTFTTDPPSIASLTTNAVTNITSIKATSGGVIIDSGGVGITAKGVCWSTLPNPTIALPTKTNDGIGNASYTSSIKILAPSTTYYVRAYATNSVGTAYGNEISFTTSAPQPVIITTTGNSSNSIAFGNVIVNNISSLKSYTLIASALTPAAGNITITAPAGFEVSLSPVTGFGSTLNVPYTAASIASTTIYVRFVPTQFGSYSGIITHSGGGAVAINIDNVNVSGTGIQNPGDFSNTGTDFWVGYGFQALMTGSNNQDMVLYISSKQNAVVTVEIGKPTDANYYIQTYNVVANTATATFPLPKTGVQDSRLNSTGVLPRGIHVYSNGVPFSLWEHIYAASSSGASLILPVNTWGSNYSVLTVGGKTNSGVPHSFFYVQAAENNTIVDIVPSDDITATANGTTTLYPAGVPFTITLNKGDVFNALGKLLSTSVGVDLTGTTVISRDCNKKIALFTGNGRVQLFVGGCTSTNGGSDNFLQQMFPKQAWGTKYVTSPFRDMEAGLYKVIVSDPATVVTVNGTALTGLVQNAYTIETDTLLNITSDKPVMVAQFCATNKCNGTGIPSHPNTGDNGDPEMVILSPVQQAINDVTVYSTNNYGIQHNYINVIIPNSGVANFLFDGVNASTAFSTHTADANYSYAVFSDLIGNTSHRLQSNIAFNAIAYGFSSSSTNESYGYNAGTNIKALSQYLSVKNTYPNVSSDSIISACLNNDFKYTVTLPYKPNSMKWDFFNNTSQLPNSDTVLVNNPVPTDSSTVGGVKLYKYSLPTTYQFNSTGSFPVNISVNATNADGCSGIQTITFSVKVVSPPTPKFTLNYNPCLPTILNYKDSSYDKNGTKMVGREWTFFGFTPIKTSTDSMPVINYTSAGNYDVKLRAINAIGCYQDTTVTVTLYNLPTVSNLTATPSGPSCVGKAITFSATGNSSLGTITKYYWNFGDGKVDSSNTNSINYTYSTANVTGYTVSVYVKTSVGCVSSSIQMTQPVHKVTADFTFITPKCINTPVLFTDASTGKVTNATIDTKWNWSFGDPANSTATTTNTTFTYTTAGTYNVKLKTSLVYATTTTFCSDSITKQIVIQPKLATPIVAVNSAATTTSSLTFTWAAISNATSYQVSTNAGVSWVAPSSGPTGTTHILSGLTPNTVYNLCVQALGNCPSDTACASGRTKLPTTDFYVPNAFSPNNQGPNDKLVICGYDAKSIKFMVFSQWGEKIYETSNPTALANGCYETWDGYSKGKPQPIGVYVYVANVVLNDGRVINKKGMFSLMR